MSSRFGRSAAILPARPEDEFVRLRIVESIAAQRALLDHGLVGRAAEIAECLIGCLSDGGKLLLFGNGGSAADATHLAAEFVGRFRRDRAPLPALSLTDNASSLSAIGNDYAYAEVFARQVRAFGQQGDVALGMTTSGNSPNVVEGLRAARESGLGTVALTGAAGGAVVEDADLSLCVPATETARVQECHMLVGHIVCELVEEALFPLS
jgi:D-sedoheptulose 7-phosphate isomerase